MKPKAVYLINQSDAPDVFGPEEHNALTEAVSFILPPMEPSEVIKRHDALREIEIIFSGWGAPCFDDQLLALMPNLRAVFHAAGSVKFMISDAFWARGISLSSAGQKNAIPVAEFAVSQIIFCLKHGWQRVAQYRKNRKYDRIVPNMPGAFHSTVGLLSLGHSGRLVAERLRPLDVKIIAYDPFVSLEVASALNVDLVSLETVFSTADVVSCHTPHLPQTNQMLRREHFQSMRPGATFINTARGAVAHEPELIEVLKKRPDVFAVLDVTDPEPPAFNSPLFALANVVLTPHIAGSLGHECRRLGRMAVDEYFRYASGQPLLGEVTAHELAIKA
jgi:phosphoglycerate dehydrogenase-like enzyme